jgi:hypothetical protein
MKATLAKKKVLLHWWYDRKDLIRPFISMHEEFDFTVIFYKHPEQETSDLSQFPFKRIYWLDYDSPKRILNNEQPDLIVLFGFEGYYTIALLLAAKASSIPTCYVSHGLQGSLADLLQKQNLKIEDSTPMAYRKNNPLNKSKRWKSIYFFLGALSLRNLRVWPFAIRYIFESVRKGSLELKLTRMQTPLRLPDYQVFFAPAYTRTYVERDNLSLKNVIYSGPYTMDAQFTDIFKTVGDSGSGNHVLLIDQPMITLSTVQMADFYLRVGKSLQEIGKKLIIKLHPLNYNAEWLPIDASIEYSRDETSISQLVDKASACMGFYSALLLPVICKRKCILFNPGNNSIVKAWEEIGVAKVVDFYSFKSEDLLLDDFVIHPQAKEKFIQEFIHDTSGRCTENLRNILLDIANKSKASARP